MSSSSTSLKGNAAIAASEKAIGRNPHPDFAKVQASRSPYPRREWQQYQTPKPDWKAGTGSNGSDPDWSKKKIVSIDPYEAGRPAAFNYKLLISALIPRPIGFVSTLAASEGETGGPRASNLAPFSYTQMLNHDPPIFVIGFAGSLEGAKDTLRNLVDTKECVINIISDHFIEAANYCSINAPAEVSEWDLSGLTPIASEVVKPARVHESIFTAECRVVEYREWKNKVGKTTGVTVFAEAVLFHAREDAINADRNILDPAVLRPVSRLGGITYSTIDTGFELPRPDFDAEQGKPEVQEILGKL